MMRKLIIATFLICAVFSAAVFAYEDSASFVTSQAAKLEDSKAMDFFFFPSRIEFANLSASWSTSPTGETSVVISVRPTIITDSFETTSIDALFADISSDGGKTWSYTKFSRSDSETEDGVWKVALGIPEWKPAAPSPEPPLTDDSSNAATDTFKTGKPAIIEIPENHNLIVCFWALDSLGNVTAEMYRQTKPMTEPEVRFRPLIIDPSDPDRAKSKKEFKKSPDRDIEDTAGAWVRDYFFFRMRVAGKLLQNMSVPPGYNYFIIRFIDLDTHSFLAQLGEGMYQYYSIFPPSNKLLSRKESEGIPFFISYDYRNLFQLVTLISEAKKNGSYPIVADYEKMLLEEGLQVSIDGSIPNPLRRTVSNTGLVVRHAMDSVYWRVDADAFEREGAFPRGLSVRFYTGYVNDLESSSIVMDDRTGYTTLYFENHVFEKDKSEPATWHYIKAADDNMDDIDPRMKEELEMRGIPLPEREEGK